LPSSRRTGESSADPAGSSASDLLRDERSLENLESGGLPVSALERLENSRERHAYTSDLSVAELVAIRRVGFQPLGLVMGSSVYQMGAQWGYRAYGVAAGGYVQAYPCPHAWMHEGMRTGYNWEHTTYEQGIREARDLAMSRLIEETRALGAHGVVGVEMTLRHLEGTLHTIEMTLIGTAVACPSATPLQEPFTCHLSGQDVAKLLEAGFAPSALVMSVCALEMDPGCGTEARGMAFGNVEMPQFSDGVQACRDQAVRRLETEAASFGDAVVGVQVDFAVRELPGEAKLADMRLVGTAVRLFERRDPPSLSLPILRLSDRRHSLPLSARRRP
jgi:uncharacterized protein YbjQ (UPF0145 family)